MTDERYAELAARLDALEQRLSPGLPTEAAGSLPADVFWALEALERRAPDAVVFAGSVDAPGGGRAKWQLTRGAAELVDGDWSSYAGALSALGHPVRLQILQQVVRQEATTAAELSRTEGLGSTGQIYHHLRQLVSAGWLRTGTRGTHEVPPERLVPLLVVFAAAGSPA